MAGPLGIKPNQSPEELCGEAADSRVWHSSPQIDSSAAPSRSFCVLAATPFEFDLVTDLLEALQSLAPSGLKGRQGRYGRNRVTVFQTQIRAKGAGIVFDFLHRTRSCFDLALVCGFAAGLSPAVQVGDVVLYDRCLSAGEEAGECHVDPSWIRVIQRVLNRTGISLARCTGLTIDRVLTTADEKIVLGRRFSAQAADMESYHILRGMQKLAVPALVLRAISDDVTQTVPNLDLAIDEAGGLQISRLLRLFLRRPLPAARLARTSWRAADSLRRAVHSILSSC